MRRLSRFIREVDITFLIMFSSWHIFKKNQNLNIQDLKAMFSKNTVNKTIHGSLSIKLVVISKRFKPKQSHRIMMNNQKAIKTQIVMVKTQQKSSSVLPLLTARNI